MQLPETVRTVRFAGLTDGNQEVENNQLPKSSRIGLEDISEENRRNML